MTAVFSLHATPGAGREAAFEIERKDIGAGPYDLLGVTVDDVRLDLYLSPEQTRELYAKLGAHLTAEEWPAQAA